MPHGRISIEFCQSSEVVVLYSTGETVYHKYEPNNFLLISAQCDRKVIRESITYGLRMLCMNCVTSEIWLEEM